MAKITITIEDKKGEIGVIYKLEMDPQPQAKENLTLAHNLGLTMFDAVEDILKKHGALVKPALEVENAQTPGR